nr:hypothetical protein [Tanacetum cinerariifolium]
FPKSYLDPEGDMLLFEAFLNDDHSSDFKTKFSSTSLNSLLEETNNFDNSLPKFTTFSNVLFDAKYESDSSDDQSSSDEDVLETIVSKPLSKEEIIPMESLPRNASASKKKSLSPNGVKFRGVPGILYKFSYFFLALSTVTASDFSWLRHASHFYIRGGGDKDGEGDDGCHGVTAAVGRSLAGIWPE